MDQVFLPVKHEDNQMPDNQMMDQHMNTHGLHQPINNPSINQMNDLNNNNNELNSDMSTDQLGKLEMPIPPLHVQQKYLNDSSKVMNTEDVQYLTSSCSRCKKKFEQPLIVPKKVKDPSNNTKPLMDPKIFKLCQHCRELQRQRSRRWQKKTKEKVGVCRRCGNDIPPELQKFVLCLNCRQNLRFRKANRAKQGRCVHCSGPLDTSIIADSTYINPDGSDNPNNNDEHNGGKRDRNFKVCRRCRENDKIRRNNLEKLGNCNRCAKPLSEEDIGKHKVCQSCRNKKKKSISSDSNPTHLLNNLGDPNLMHEINMFNNYNQTQIQQQISQALQPQNPVPQGRTSQSDSVTHTSPVPVNHAATPHQQQQQQQPQQQQQQQQPIIQHLPNVYNDMQFRQGLPIHQLPIQNPTTTGNNNLQQPPLNMIQSLQPLASNQMNPISNVQQQMPNSMSGMQNMQTHLAQGMTQGMTQGVMQNPLQQQLPMNNYHNFPISSMNQYQMNVLPQFPPQYVNNQGTNQPQTNQQQPQVHNQTTQAQTRNPSHLNQNIGYQNQM